VDGEQGRGRAVDESITFTNKDGMQFNADISLSYHLSASRCRRST
jgi:hypothetical protein